MASFKEYYKKDSKLKFYEYRIKYKDPKTNDWKEKSKKGFSSPKECKKAAEEMERKLGLGIDIAKEEMFVKDYLQYWFDTFKKNTVSWGTEKTIHQAIDICTEHLGYVRMKDLDKEKFQGFINTIAPSYTKSTLQRHNSRLSEAFEEAVPDIIRKNPAKKTKYPRTCKPIKNKKKNIELDECLDLIKAIEEYTPEEFYQYKYITYALIGTGSRIGEICAISEKDVDFNEKLLNIDKTYIKEDLIWKVKPTTKTGESGERVIGLDDFTLAKLEEYKKIRNAIIQRNGLKSENVPTFFITQTASFVKTSNYGDWLNKLCNRFKLRHYTPHMFRHTHETIMWESGVSDINFIGGRLGDKDKSILLNTYGHKSNISEQRNMEKINEFMSLWAVRGQEVLDKAIEP
jgi:integrase